MLSELNDMAGQHETMAEKLTSVVIAMLQSSVLDIRQERKKVCHSCEFSHSAVCLSTLRADSNWLHDRPISKCIRYCVYVYFHM